MNSFVFKKILSFGFLSTLSLGLWGQSPVLTAENYTPEIGERWEAEYITNFGSFDPGPAGENQSWDFSDLGQNGSFALEMDIQAVEDSPASENFPQSTFVWHFSTFEIYNFYFADQDSLVLYGGTSVTGAEFDILTVYTDPQDAFKFPMEYGYNNSYFGAFETTVFGNITTMDERSGTVDIDAYGTIITPYGTFENVLRMVIQDQTSFLESTQYAWVQPGSFIPIMVYEFDSDGGASIYYAKKIEDDNPTAIQDYLLKDTRLNVFEASSQHLNFLFQTQEAIETVHFQLSNTNGQLISQLNDQQMPNQNQTFELKLPNVSPGVYVLTAQTDVGIISQKVFIP